MTRDLPLFDFRGGVNRSFTEDTVDMTELLTATNVRLSERYGGIVKRGGTQRIHTDQLESGAAILGLFQWDHATAKLVAICNGDLFHKTLAATTWTNVAGTLSTTNRCIFQQHVIAGSPTLYFANGEYCKWDGTTLTEAVAGAPNALFIAFYKGRMFASDGTKTLYWSAIADPDTWAAPDGGSDPVGVSDAEGIVGLCPVGTSLLVFKEDSIARFTGVTQDTIRVDEETEGISPDIGCIAPGTICRVEDFVFFLSDRGPYIATEAGVQSVGQKLERDMRLLDGDYRTKAWAIHNKRQGEIWLFVPEAGQTTNNVCWIWNYRMGSWTGPHNFSSQFDASVATAYELPDGTESILVGGYDGRVRDGDVSPYLALYPSMSGTDWIGMSLASTGYYFTMSGDDIVGIGATGELGAMQATFEDTGATSIVGTVDAATRLSMDDLNQDGSGGTAITMTVKLPPLLMGVPHKYKMFLRTQAIQADLKTDGSLTITTTSESQASDSMTLASLGTGAKAYGIRPLLDGYRPEFTVSDATAEMVEINGFVFSAEIGREIL